MKLDDIAQALKDLYPTAVAARLFVIESSYNIEVEYKPSIVGASYKQLNGEWSPKRETPNA